MSGVSVCCFGKENLLYNSLSTDDLSRFFWVMGVTSQATFEIPFSTKLFSGSRWNFEDGCQDIRQLLVTSYPGERQFFLSPHAENVVYLALEVLQYISYRISLLTPVTSFLFVCFFLLLLKNFCAHAPCKNYGTCQSGFTRKRYRCLCASGFTGHDCEEGDA